MKSSYANTHEVIIVGVGGKGALTIGQMLARAAMSRYQHVLWSPSYFAALRGGASDCTVILSDEEINCPLPEKVEALIILETPRFKAFEASLYPGGAVVLESSGFKSEVARRDIRVYPVPAIEMAGQLGNPLVANFILLGAYVSITKVISLGLCEQELRQRFSGREQEINLEALMKGALIGEEQNKAG